MSLRFIALALLLAASTTSAQLSFQPAVNTPVGTQPEGIVIADFNGDGHRDVAVTSDGPDKVSIFLNNGSGTFSPGQVILTGGGTSAHALAAADFDGNSTIDLAVTLKNVNRVHILTNNGMAQFTFSPVGYPVGSEARSLSAADIDNNGTIDLVTSNRDSDTVSVLRNLGNGTFMATQTYAAGSEPRAAVFGDVNGDNRPDIVVSSHDTRQILILLNDGAGGFVPGSALSVGNQLRPEGVVVADFDNDGHRDIVAATSGNGMNLVTTFKNLGGGTFGGPVSFPVGGGDPSEIVAADFDMDGNLDVATANSDTHNVSILRNVGALGFGAPVVVAVGNSPQGIAAGDLDGNGSPDIVTANDGSNNFSSLRNNAAGASLSLLAPAVRGMTTTMRITSSADGGRAYVAAFATGTTPGFDLGDGRIVPLNPDFLFMFSITPGNGIFVNNVGTLNAGGQADVLINVPNLPALQNVTIFAAAVIGNPAASLGIGRITSALPILIQ